MKFVVKEVEFEFEENVKEYQKLMFYSIFEIVFKDYAPKTTLEINENTIKFNKFISVNTINKVLANIASPSEYIIKEIEYEYDDKKVEVEIEIK